MVGDSRMKDPELVIQYFPDSDTLRLGAGAPAAEGETIAKWLMVEWDSEDAVTGVVLRNAAKVLRPYLFPENETGARSEEQRENNRKGQTLASSSGNELLISE